GTHQPTNHQTAHWQTNQSTHNHAHKNKKVHWHTIEFSNIITTQQPHTPWHAAHCEQKELCFVRACFPIATSARNTHRSCGALSVALTHIKLHTTQNKHKSPGQVLF
ncbi:hypothetical protein RAE13_07135, partial [Corynebacterium curieae]